MRLAEAGLDWAETVRRTLAAEEGREDTNALRTLGALLLLEREICLPSRPWAVVGLLLGDLDLLLDLLRRIRAEYGLLELRLRLRRRVRLLGLELRAGTGLCCGVCLPTCL